MALTQLLNFVCNIPLGYPKTEPADKNIKGLCNEEGGKIHGNGNMYTNSGSFKMPLHYPRYKKSDYEKMEEWSLDNLLQQYGLTFDGSLEEKRAYAMGAFLWPDQL
ncbi:hypothetical protein CDL12_08716 [Handroanthus impetiginosus]|uniref:DUF7722 domain-containing protein n=1 Tax=Handroanthus impetiginosus TaxID=429701 RepID=A0A2G9HMF1_9LAMI|nr:hypothetical protein CDL12_08716 [Handroanthus impetiginosus]